MISGPEGLFTKCRMRACVVRTLPCGVEEARVMISSDEERMLVHQCNRVSMLEAREEIRAMTYAIYGRMQLSRRGSIKETISLRR